MAPQECKAKHTSTEFVKWVVFLDRQVNAFDKQAYYFAKLCVILKAIHNMLAGKKEELDIEKELLRFESTKETTTTEYTEVRKMKKTRRKKITRQKLEMSKSIIFASIGLNPDGSPPDEVKTQRPPNQRK